MNETIELLLNHRSIRQFEEKTLSREQIEMIVSCAQSASTSNFIQAYSIIGVSDQDKKDQLADLVGDQNYVAKNGHFFIFCADLNRHALIGEMENKDVLPSIESTEKFMVTLIDATLAAQNAAIAAESMGLGICYIGGIRNQIGKVCELLKTPSYVLPLFGIAVGYPEKVSNKKPRLPLNHVYHENEYEQDVEKIRTQLQEYNEVISAYYKERTKGARTDTWTSQVAHTLEKKQRMEMQSFIQSKKLNVR